MHKLNRQQPNRSLLETFLCLCQITTPHGYESYCWPFLPRPNKRRSVVIDSKDNIHITVRKKNNEASKILWTSHLDTACHYTRLVNFLIDKNSIISTDGKTLLGADDKIGVAIMIKMIEANVPGWYIFQTGEERGRIGSRYSAREIEKKVKDGKTGPKICISFDRYGYTDIITHQCLRRTCSDTFAKALSAILNKEGAEYSPCRGGLYTDSMSYADFVAECTNISVGYDGHHTNAEQQDIRFAEQLLLTILKHHEEIEDIIVSRDPAEKEKEKETWSYGYGFNQGWHRQHKARKKTGKFSVESAFQLMLDQHTNNNKEIKKTVTNVRWILYGGEWICEYDIGHPLPGSIKKLKKFKRWFNLKLKNVLIKYQSEGRNLTLQERKDNRYGEGKTAANSTIKSPVVRSVVTVPKTVLLPLCGTSSDTHQYYNPDDHNDPYDPDDDPNEPTDNEESEILSRYNESLAIRHHTDCDCFTCSKKKQKSETVYWCSDCKTIQRPGENMYYGWEPNDIIFCYSCGTPLEPQKASLITLPKERE